MSRFMKYARQHPLEAMAILFAILIGLVAIVGGLLLNSPNAVLCIFYVFAAFLVILPIFQTYLYLKQKSKLVNLTLDDMKKMYTEYETLVENQIRLQNYDKELIPALWLEDYHELFYVASQMLDANTKFTDFHIAACMMFALVPEDASLSHIRFVYDCVRDLISEPRVYTRHVNYGGKITLEEEETLPKANLATYEASIPVEDICKVIYASYLKNKNEYTLIGLADFFKYLHDSCD